jgi:hypothetical protein
MALAEHFHGPSFTDIMPKKSDGHFDDGFLFFDLGVNSNFNKEVSDDILSELPRELPVEALHRDDMLKEQLDTVARDIHLAKKACASKSLSFKSSARDKCAPSVEDAPKSWASFRCQQGHDELTKQLHDAGRHLLLQKQRSRGTTDVISWKDELSSGEDSPKFGSECSDSRENLPELVMESAKLRSQQKLMRRGGTATTQDLIFSSPVQDLSEASSIGPVSLGATTARPPPPQPRMLPPPPATLSELVVKKNEDDEDECGPAVGFTNSLASSVMPKQLPSNAARGGYVVEELSFPGLPSSEQYPTVWGGMEIALPSLTLESRTELERYCQKIPDLQSEGSNNPLLPGDLPHCLPREFQLRRALRRRVVDVDVAPPGALLGDDEDLKPNPLEFVSGILSPKELSLSFSSY